MGVLPPVLLLGAKHEAKALAKAATRAVDLSAALNRMQGIVHIAGIGLSVLIRVIGRRVSSRLMVPTERTALIGPGRGRVALARAVMLVAGDLARQTGVGRSDAATSLGATVDLGRDLPDRAEIKVQALRVEHQVALMPAI
jgi:hypothetical protein